MVSTVTIALYHSVTEEVHHRLPILLTAFVRTRIGPLPTTLEPPVFSSARPLPRPSFLRPTVQPDVVRPLPQRGTAPNPVLTRYVAPLALYAQRCGWASGVIGVGWSLAAVCAPAATVSFTAAPIAYKIILSVGAAAGAYVACDTVSSAAWTLLGVIAGVLYAPAAIPAAGLSHIIGSAALGGFTTYHVGKRINTFERGLWLFAAIATAALTLNAARLCSGPPLSNALEFRH
jgi:hypothetical protein